MPLIAQEQKRKIRWADFTFSGMAGRLAESSAQ